MYKMKILIFQVVKLRYVSQEINRPSGKPWGKYFSFSHLTLSKVFWWIKLLWLMVMFCFSVGYSFSKSEQENILVVK